eukprot:4341910-Prymnesium_polylepis.3
MLRETDGTGQRLHTRVDSGSCGPDVNSEYVTGNGRYVGQRLEEKEEEKVLLLLHNGYTHAWTQVRAALRPRRRT